MLEEIRIQVEKNMQSRVKGIKNNPKKNAPTGYFAQLTVKI